ncbi:hypothetical protein EJ110_NYTH36555 [Nymphaea thermarum]|nr:hypothetical protein EJ110_NYTH36555 [Nymphaea thermarum]
MNKSFDFFAPPPPPPPFDISEPQQSEPSSLTAHASDKESGRVRFEQKRAVGKLHESRDDSRFRRKAAAKPEEDIDQSAEAFIKKFHTELRMQRLESIENYHQMLARGT